MDRNIRIIESDIDPTAMLWQNTRITKSAIGADCSVGDNSCIEDSSIDEGVQPAKEFSCKARRLLPVGDGIYRIDGQNNKRIRI